MEVQDSLHDRREYWRGVVEEWRASGVSKAAFCRERGIATWKFHYWHGRLTADPAAGKSNVGEEMFARVHATGSSGLRLLLGGLELDLEPGFDEATLLRLLRVLGVAGC
jgi:hypothetical protein